MSYLPKNAVGSRFDWGSCGSEHRRRNDRLMRKRGGFRQRFPLRIRKLVCRYRGCQEKVRYTKQSTGVILVAWVCPRCEQGYAEAKRGQYPLRRTG